MIHHLHFDEIVAMDMPHVVDGAKLWAFYDIVMEEKTYVNVVDWRVQQFRAARAG